MLSFGISLRSTVQGLHAGQEDPLSAAKKIASYVSIIFFQHARGLEICLKEAAHRIVEHFTVTQKSLQCTPLSRKEYV